MKKIRTLAAVLLAAALLAASALPAAAEDYTGGSDWNCTFDGSEMTSNFSSSSFADTMNALQPGDSAVMTVQIQNTSDEITDWYMTNEVLRSLEESQEVARSGGYTYELVYTGPSGEQAVLYSSEAIGGEKDQTAGLGLHEATDSLEDYFYLDQLLEGQSARVDLTVSLDGETQGNAYQDTLAQLQMNFAVELKTTADGGRFDEEETKEANERSKRTVYVTRIVSKAVPKTGDDSNPALIAVVCGFSGAALLILGIVRLRRNKRREDD